MPWLALPWSLAAYCYLTVLTAHVAQADTNVTLNDSDSAISYRPLSSWKTDTSGCNFAYNCTWHETIEHGHHAHEPIIMEFNFTGTAIYLYSISDGSRPHPSLSFNLDKRNVSSLVETPLDAATSDSSFFSYWNLPSEEHNLLVTLESGSKFRFDYLVYTAASTPMQPVAPSSVTEVVPSQTESSNPSAQSSNDTNSGPTQVGAIAIAIASSVGITSLFSIGLAISIIKIRKQRSRGRGERRAERSRDCSQALTTHLPPALSSAYASASRVEYLPRYSEEPRRPPDPPPYDVVIMQSQNSLAPPHGELGPYLTQGSLYTIDEVSTSRSSQSFDLTESQFTREASIIETPSSPLELPGHSVNDAVTISAERRATL